MPMPPGRFQSLDPVPGRMLETAQGRVLGQTAYGSLITGFVPFRLAARV